MFSIATPATVRQKEDGRYELISGHRRKRACELAGFDTLRCEVVELNRDEATILMVESNYQRSQILPSEKAYAYKMRLEAMKRQAGRPSKDNLVPVGQNFSREELATQSGESQTQIQRYIRLTNLVPELLEYVDEGRIKMRPAVELSFLDEDSQRDVVDEIDLNDATPSHDQTIRMRKFFEEGKLTTEASIGLSLDSTATECWDNPISANPNRSGIKSDIESRLNRYKNSEGFTAVWIWTEKLSDTEYNIYIGYC